MLLPQPGFFPPTSEDDYVLHSACIQKTADGQWFAMSGVNFPSLVRSAPFARWSENPVKEYSNYDELSKSIIGVHNMLNNAHPFGRISRKTNSPPTRLGIEGPVRTKLPSHQPKFQYQYDYRNQVYRPPSEISRSSPPNPLPPTPPQPPTESISRSRLMNGFLRVLENALAFFVFFIFMVFAAKYGLLNNLSGFAEFLEKLQGQPKPLTEEKITEEKSEDPQLLPLSDEKSKLKSEIALHTPPRSQDSLPTDEKSDQKANDPISITKKVEIVEPEKVDKPENEGTDGSSPPVKRRKRGTRGGRTRKLNQAKKKDREEQLLLEQGNSSPIQVITDDNIGTEPIDSSPVIPAASLLSVSKEVLGYGSHGTVVLKGSFENREVAVKRMLLDFYEVASKEVSLLQESDDHPNVIRYFCKQANDRFLYIALELCPGTLEDLIEKPEKFTNMAIFESPTQLLHQIASGVHHLHCLKIVHRDLKPQNILVAPPKTLNSKESKDNQVSLRMLISDFGLCKKLEGDQSSFRATTANAAGTSGWRAPELLIDENDSVYNHTIVSGSDFSAGSSSEPLVIDSLSNRRATRAIDIFSLGCVFYYILSKGSHPFGDKYLREANIVQGNFSLDALYDGSKPDMVEAQDLISRMIARDPKLRPDAMGVLNHPLFWPPEKRLDFVLKASDRFDIEVRDPPSELLQLLETKASEVVGPDWHTQLGQDFVENLGKYRKYHGDRIMDLLRAMRNKSHHFNDLPPNVKKAMEPYPEGYLAYFTSRFPLLLMTIYYVVKENLASEPMFRGFF